jgi:hypothetical protein
VEGECDGTTQEGKLQGEMIEREVPITKGRRKKEKGERLLSDGEGEEKN